MKNLLTFIILLVSFNCFSQTQAEMNKKANAEFNKADTQLNEIYQTILSKYKTDSVFVKNLKKTQRLWVKFRDAELKMRFPAKNKQLEYGSVYPMCIAIFIKKMTKERIETLKEWVRGAEEGDVCNGSIKIIEAIDSQNMGKAYIKKDGYIWMPANIKKDYRVFGYKNKDIYSEKMILLSIFTNEVKNNPFGCKYGAFYDTSEITAIKLKYIDIENNFLRIEIIKNKKTIDKVYMLKKWFEFEK